MLFLWLFMAISYVLFLMLPETGRDWRRMLILVFEGSLRVILAWLVMSIEGELSLSTLIMGAFAVIICLLTGVFCIEDVTKDTFLWSNLGMTRIELITLFSSNCEPDLSSNVRVWSALLLGPDSEELLCAAIS